MSHYTPDRPVDPPLPKHPRRCYRDFQELMEADEASAMRLVNQHVGNDVLNLLDQYNNGCYEARIDALRVLDKAAQDIEVD